MPKVIIYFFVLEECKDNTSWLFFILSYLISKLKNFVLRKFYECDHNGRKQPYVKNKSNLCPENSKQSPRISFWSIVSSKTLVDVKQYMDISNTNGGTHNINEVESISKVFGSEVAEIS